MAEDNKRANRGKRTHEFDDNEKREDEEFWAKNPYFNEGSSSENERNPSKEESDEDYEEEEDSFLDESEASSNSAEEDGTPLIRETEDDLVLRLNGVNFRFPDVASKDTYLKNRMLFPFVRALHYSTDISECPRLEGTSYIKPPLEFLQRSFPFDAKEPIIKENINRNLMQLPFRASNLQEVEDKTPFHGQLFDLEDNLFKKDFDLFSIRLGLKKLAEFQQSSSGNYWEKLQKIPILAKEFQECPKNEITKEMIENLEKKLQEREKMAVEKKSKTSQQYCKQTSTLFKASLDQKLYNEQCRDLKKVSNKLLRSYIEETNVSPENLHKSTDLLVIREDNLNKLPEILMKVPENTLFILPLLPQNVYQASYLWLMQDLLLSKAFAKEKLVEILDFFSTELFFLPEAGFMEPEKKLITQSEFEKLTDLAEKDFKGKIEENNTFEIQGFKQFLQVQKQKKTIYSSSELVMLLLNWHHISERLGILSNSLENIKPLELLQNFPSMFGQKKTGFEFFESFFLCLLTGKIEEYPFESLCRQLISPLNACFHNLRYLFLMARKGLQNLYVDDFSQDLWLLLRDFSKHAFSSQEYKEKALCLFAGEKEASGNLEDNSKLFSIDFNYDQGIIIISSCGASASVEEDLKNHKKIKNE